jgi:uncharacterized protein Usg
MLCIGAPSISGIGAPASTKQGTPVIKATPPDRTSADKTRFMAVEILNGVVPPFLGERHPSCVGFRCYLSNPLRDCFKRSAGPGWQQPRREAANHLLYIVFLEKEQSIGHARSTGYSKSHESTKVNDHKQALRDYRLTTAEIIYHMPDHPDLLQSFIWQKLDVAPDFPELRRFLEYWSRNIEGKLHSVRVGQARSLSRPGFNHVRTSHLSH